ncbi:hypothetical protein HXX76_004645 [Chlamydomonas incerta]|uniref:Nucleotidyltransferase n=1 Tax=Chlamydomonas incerta TaxID=51695 RepID=A0A835W4Q3_CHLIN|nr:hypothetical protein HXX76_004645 [Chlamydomonas incerta]|eukprot:KAG2439285.1 hypothetical protein HXX76_004645 [Chlamydomonas incerta]
MAQNDSKLKSVYLNLEPGGEKSYVRHFNGDLLPLTVRGVSYVAPQRATDTVYRLLQQCPELNIGRIHNGGSYGRATLVRDAFDVDVSVFVNEYKDRKLRFEDWSGPEGEQLQRAMQRDVAAWLRRSASSEGLTTPVVEVQHGTHYKHCINVKVDGVDVDIKLAPNAAAGIQALDLGKAQRDALMQALWATPAEQRRADPAREAALAEALTAGAARAHVYGICVLLEVLVLAAAQHVDSMEGCEAEVVLLLKALDFLDQAVNQGRVVRRTFRGVDQFGTPLAQVWGYSPEQAASCEYVWRYDRVKVLHPIDPTCNLAKEEPGRTVDWTALVKAAHELKWAVRKESMWQLLNGSSLAPAVHAMSRPEGAAGKVQACSSYAQHPEGSAEAERPGQWQLRRIQDAGAARAAAAAEPEAARMPGWVAPAALAAVAGLALLGGRMAWSAAAESSRERERERSRA